MGWIDPTRELAQIRAWFEARDLELAVLERPNGTWRAVVTPRDESHGHADYADGDGELEAARRARARHSTRQLRAAVSALAEAAQSEAVQILFAEIVVSRIPGGRTRAGRRAALVSAVWMLDPKRRKATRAIGRAATEWTRLRTQTPEARRELAKTTVAEIEKLQARLLTRTTPSN
ncbi:MAG: hypothetical protein ACTHQQ_00485 [Solirubrobacteraceae bacterium]